MEQYTCFHCPETTKVGVLDKLDVTLFFVVLGIATHSSLVEHVCDAVSLHRQIKKSMLGSRSQSVCSVPRSWRDRWPSYWESTVV